MPVSLFKHEGHWPSVQTRNCDQGHVPNHRLLTVTGVSTVLSRWHETVAYRYPDRFWVPACPQKRFTRGRQGCKKVSGG